MERNENRELAVGNQVLKTAKLNLILNQRHFPCSTCYVLLSGILHKRSPFRHGIAPNVFTFQAFRSHTNGPRPW